MKDKNTFIRTDLASESMPSENSAASCGIKTEERGDGENNVIEITVLNGEGERLTGKRQGTYVTVQTGKVWLNDAHTTELLTVLLANELLRLALRAGWNGGAVLTVGLGNRYVTPDALGPFFIKGITATHHIKENDPALYSRLGMGDMSALAPGVAGQTGIETFELVRCACQSVKAQIVVAVDALAARSTDRLCTTFQFSDTGIAPGSGIGNRNRPLDRESLGVPVIAVGVPTVVDSSTLICDALERAGIDPPPAELEAELENGRRFFVSLKESDIAVNELSRILSDAVTRAFSPENAPNK